MTFSKTKPAVGENVTVSCAAVQGTFLIGGYEMSFGDGGTYNGVAASTGHAWATQGTKSVACTAYDVNGLPSAARSAWIDVGGPDVGPTVTALDTTPAIVRSGIPVTLSCTATTPPGRLVAGYELDFGDSSPVVDGPSNEAVHVYQAAGTYVASCLAYDASDRAGLLERAITRLRPTYSLQVATIGSGSGVLTSAPEGINCGETCSVTIGGGETVTLTALPSAGSRFAGWSGSGCIGTGPCTLLMSAARRISATFLPEAGTAFLTLTPCRVADTRAGTACRSPPERSARSP